jgi:hypothetical protein
MLATAFGAHRDNLSRGEDAGTDARPEWLTESFLFAQANLEPREMASVISVRLRSPYADRLAKRGYDLILVARNKARLKALCARLTSETGRYMTPMTADLNRKAGLGK